MYKRHFGFLIIVSGGIVRRFHSHVTGAAQAHAASAGRQTDRRTEGAGSRSRGVLTSGIWTTVGL